MSGGVDSSVAAALLLQQGYEVVGGFIKNWSDSKDPLSGICSWRAERRDALRVAAVLDIPLLTFDFEKQYRKLIVQELYDGYKRGETPNPDVLCNEYIKFGLFWEQAKKFGFEFMATGHYAILKNDKSGNAHLIRGVDPDKDQSYFLYRVPQQVLRRTFFPIGKYKKSEIRRFAQKFRLPVAAKPDSQGICFIGKVDFSEFLSNKLKNNPGDIVTSDGKVIGTHFGLHNYTIGQRQRIAIADKHPWFVAQKDIKNNCLIVVDSEDHPLMQAKELIITDLHWVAGKTPKLPLNVSIQVRYRQSPHQAKIFADATSKSIKIKLKKYVKAAAIGQSVVIYHNSECLGGGVIRQTMQV